MSFAQLSRCLSRRQLLFATAAGVLSAAAGCLKPEPPLGDAPLKKLPETVAEGVTLWKTTIPGPNDYPMAVWIYLPSPAPVRPVPCVLVAPAGTPLYIGSALSKEDMDEHIPYAKAGFVTVAYSIDGDPGTKTEASMERAANEFWKAKAGTDNARRALDFALAHVPQIDSRHVFAAGHSSAATLALQVTVADTRIHGCMAYAPRTDLEDDFAKYIADMRRSLPWVDDFVSQYSPKLHAQSLKCPLFLFHADDDSVVPAQDNIAYAEAVQRAGNPDVTFIRVPSGDHYDSMIQQGIPDGIEWLKKQVSR